VTLVLFDEAHPAHIFLIGCGYKPGKARKQILMFDLLKQIEHQERIKRKS